MPELRIVVPGPDQPGYLRRTRQIARIQTKLNAGDLTGIEDLVAFLQEFVDADEGVDAEEALLDLSQDEYMALMQEFANAGNSRAPKGAN